MIQYPLSKHMKETIKSKTGKKLQDVTIDTVLRGEIDADDIKISRETLSLQGEIAKADGKKQMAENFNRAGELTEVSDALILEIYNKLRPHRSTKEELLSYASRLEGEYKATECAKLIREAAMIYERRGILLK